MRTMRVQIPPFHPDRFWIDDFGFLIQIRNPQSKIPNRPGAVAERLMHFAVYEDDDGSSPFGPANNRGHLAETDQRRPEEPKSLVRYQERPPGFPCRPHMLAANLVRTACVSGRPVCIW